MNLHIVSGTKDQRIGVSHAAVTANTSVRLASVEKVRQIDTKTLKAAMMPSLPFKVSIFTSKSIESTGIIAAIVLVSQNLSLYTVSS